MAAAEMNATVAMASAAEMAAAEVTASEAVPREAVAFAMMPTAVMATAEVAAPEAVAPATEMAAAMTAASVTSASAAEMTAAMTAAMTATSVTSASAAFPHRRTRHHGRENQNGNSNEGLRHGILAAPLIASQTTLRIIESFLRRASGSAACKERRKPGGFERDRIGRETRQSIRNQWGGKAVLRLGVYAKLGGITNRMRWPRRY
jgi:hypothetical protein